MSRAVVINGEASETDSEEEINSNNYQPIGSVLGKAVSGEDTESDNDLEGSICSAVSALNEIEIEEENQNEKYDSLFHIKLREYNENLNEALNNFCSDIVEEAGKNLNTIDQQLLRSQITLQNAVTCLKSLNFNSSNLKSKLHSLLSAKFIPNVRK